MINLLCNIILIIVYYGRLCYLYLNINSVECNQPADGILVSINTRMRRVGSLIRLAIRRND